MVLPQIHVLLNNSHGELLSPNTEQLLLKIMFSKPNTVHQQQPLGQLKPFRNIHHQFQELLLQVWVELQFNFTILQQDFTQFQTFLTMLIHQLLNKPLEN